MLHPVSASVYVANDVPGGGVGSTVRAGVCAGGGVWHCRISDAAGEQYKTRQYHGNEKFHHYTGFFHRNQPYLFTQDRMPGLSI